MLAQFIIKFLVKSVGSSYIFFFIAQGGKHESII